LPESEGLLESVLARLLAEGLVAEAAVASVEAAGLLASLGRAGEIPDRVAVTRGLCACHPALVLADRALSDLASPESRAKGKPALRRQADRYARGLRQALRLRGFRVEPPPAA
jgi:hypothetical protein